MIVKPKTEYNMKKSLLLFLSILLVAASMQMNAQTSYQFTTGSATGATGPTQAQLNSAYLGTNLQGAVTSTNGIQFWTVPTTGVYSIEATGAQGYGPFGGRGARIKGDFSLTAGDVLKIVVGQEGVAFSGAGTNQYGGGGGSFVTDNTNTPYVVAGGGGGNWVTSFNATVDASITTSGNAGVSGAGAAAGGTAGQGGGSFSSADGGGGLLTNGAGTSGGFAFVNGAGGGVAVNGGNGGFGGGGGGSSWNNQRCGGGGGYSGGGGAYHSSSTGGNPQGGGGGSFNAGTNPEAVAGFQLGDGTVTITPLTSPAPNNAGVALFVSPVFVNNTICAGIANVEVAIQNFGSNQINSVDVDWTFGGVAQPTFNYTSLLDTFGGSSSSVDTITLGTVNISGNSELVAWTTMPNGVADTVNTNDTASLSIDSVITIELDLGPDKTVCDGSFIILENIGSTQVYSSYTWSTGSSTPTIITNTPGTYSLTVTYGPPQCIAADQIDVIGASNPIVDLGPDSTYCANEFMLDAGGDGATYAWSDGSSTQTNTVTNSGNYSVTVTSDDGCIVEDDINLTLLETPIVDLGEDFKLCISFDQTQLLSAGNSFSSYLWSTGATTSNIVVGAGVTTVGNQTYSVTVTADNGCTGEDAVVVEYSMCVGINESAENSSISLFPNPATDVVTFTTVGTSLQEVNIYDLTGKMIYSNISNNDRLDVNTSAFASGTYIVKVVTESESVTRRLIVQ